MKIKFIERDTPEWDFMWAELAKHEYNKDNEQPTVCEFCGETWQYMDTAIYDKQWQHCFRHRMHPKFDGKRCYLQFPVSQNFKP